MATVYEAEAVEDGEEYSGEMEATAQATQQTMMQTRSSYSTAMQVQKPRNLTRVQHILLQEARLSGEGFYYGWGTGKNAIEGASQELAHAAARCYGNCAVEMMPVQDLPDAWVFTAAFIDLETGFTLARQYRQSKKSVVHGKHDPERKADMRFAIGQSKAARNVVLKAVPQFLIDKAIEEAKSGVREKLETYVEKHGLPAAVDYAMKELGKVGVKEEFVLSKLEVADRRAVDIEMLVVLRGDLAAIQKGKERAEDLFAGLAESEKKVGKSKLNETLAPKRSVGEEAHEDLPPAGPQRQPGDEPPDLTELESLVAETAAVNIVTQIESRWLSRDPQNDEWTGKVKAICDARRAQLRKPAKQTEIT